MCADCLRALHVAGNAQGWPAWRVEMGQPDEVHPGVTALAQQLAKEQQRRGPDDQHL